MVRVFAYDAMGRQIIMEPFELFLIPASAKQLV